MSTPSGLTFPSLEVREGHLFVVKKASTVIGQVASIRHQSNAPTRKIPRLGDTSKYTSYAPAEFSVSLEIYIEGDPDQLALILAGTTKPGSGGWVGTEKLRLNPSVTAYDLTIEQYRTNTGTSDTLEGAWTLDNFKPSSMAVQLQSDSVGSIQLSGECDDVYYMPGAGIGV